MPDSPSPGPTLPRPAATGSHAGLALRYDHSALAGASESESLVPCLPVSRAAAQAPIEWLTRTRSLGLSVSPGRLRPSRVRGRRVRLGVSYSDTSWVSVDCCAYQPEAVTVTSPTEMSHVTNGDFTVGKVQSNQRKFCSKISRNVL